MLLQMAIILHRYAVIQSSRATGIPSHLRISQFWPSLASEGNPDNYLACGECFELVQTHPNGSDYASGDPGYTDPIVLETVDSCPCDANPKWCCKFRLVSFV